MEVDASANAGVTAGTDDPDADGNVDAGAGADGCDGCNFEFLVGRRNAIREVSLASCFVGEPWVEAAGSEGWNVPSMTSSTIKGMSGLFLTKTQLVIR